MALFKQATGETREAIRTGEIQQETAKNLEISGVEDSSGNFSFAVQMSAAQLKTIAETTGCASWTPPMNCSSNSIYREINGVCNNRRNPYLGVSNRPFARWLPPDYEDAISLPRGWQEGKLYNGHPLPLVREVSNTIARCIDGAEVEDSGRSQLFMSWGQWLDHDLDFSPEGPVTCLAKTECAATCASKENCFPIQIPLKDPKGNRRGKCMVLFRTGAACSVETVVRQQVNALTSFIDAGMVYGNEECRALRLRNLTSQLGLLAVNMRFNDGGRSYLPFDVETVDPCAPGTACTSSSPCASVNTSYNIPCFIAGDTRANQQPALMTLHTLFLREHNRLATELKGLNPHWDGEKLYQETRKIIGAMMQIITYRDYLPLVLGNKMDAELPLYSTYNETVDPGISNVFVFAFRFGHASIPPYFFHLNHQYKTAGHDYKVRFHETLFATWRLPMQGGIDPWLRGLLVSEAKLMMQNKVMSEEVRERLFAKTGQLGLDLASLNMQRGRDHGIPSYTSWRRFCGLSVPRNQAELGDVLKNRDLARKFMEVYKTPQNIDLWIGGIAEPFVKNGRVGPLFTCLIGRQFRRIRNGDRFWWQNPGVFTPQQLSTLGGISLSRIICDHTTLKQAPMNVFLDNKPLMDFVSCDKINKLDLSAWIDVK